MSARQRGKHATFAARARRERVVDRIMRANRDRPGFLGVAHGITIDGQRITGNYGVVCWRQQPGPGA